MRTGSVFRLVLVFLVLLPPLVACGAMARLGQPVMGTVLQVAVVAEDRDRAHRLAVAAIAEARRWDDILTTWREEGELARLNGRAGAGPVPISDELAHSLRQMLQLSRATGGAFDPGVGPLVERWRGPLASSGGGGTTAVPHRIASVLTLHSDLTAELAAGAMIDAGGIGKGIALDAMATMLRRRGVSSAFLDFGGSSHIALGAPPDDPSGWTLLAAGLEAGQVLGLLHLRDAALSTSRATGGASAAGPIIDPASGEPVLSTRLATVLAADATTAEAWSTALVVLGRHGLEAAKAAGIDALMVDAQGMVHTAGFPLDERTDAATRPQEHFGSR